MATSRRPPAVLMRQWAIYERPLDYPKGFVVREWIIMRGDPEPHSGPATYHETLGRARHSGIPTQANLRIPRYPDDPPTLVEVWV